MTDQQDKQQAVITDQPDDSESMLTQVMAFVNDYVLVYGEMVLNIFLDYILYVILAYILYQIGLQLKSRVMSLWVQADLNEWVVITRGGKLVQAGIGLSCFRTPFDSVAIFPSKLTKVEVQTQQITQEMQGVQVNSMLEWCVDRDGIGPVRAFQMLGLIGGNFNNANQTLRDLTSAIVRHQIANASIDQLIKERDAIRQAIIDDITEQAKGWGVHLATVEITDVRILSGSLFNNLQTQFREENNKKATLERLEVEDGIWREQMQHSLTTCKRDAEANKVERFAQMENALKRKALERKAYEEQMTLKRKQTTRANDNSYDNTRRYYQKETQNSNNALERKKNEIARQIKEEINQRDVTAKENENQLQQVKFDLAMKEKKAQDARNIKKEGYDLEKELLDDPTQRKLKKMKAIQDLHTKMQVGGIRMNMMGNENPISYLMKQFDSLFDEGEKGDLAQSKVITK